MENFTPSFWILIGFIGGYVASLGLQLLQAIVADKEHESLCREHGIQSQRSWMKQ